MKQASGLSATHEEYREAKDKRPVIAFVQDGVSRDANQAAFVSEVQAWDSGEALRSKQYCLQQFIMEGWQFDFARPQDWLSQRGSDRKNK